MEVSLRFDVDESNYDFSKGVRKNPYAKKLKQGFSVTVNRVDGSSKTSRYEDMDAFSESQNESVADEDEKMTLTP